MYPVLRFTPALTISECLLSLGLLLVSRARDTLLSFFYPFFSFLLSFSLVRDAIDAATPVVQLVIADYAASSAELSVVGTVCHELYLSLYTLYDSSAGATASHWAATGYRCLPTPVDATVHYCVTAAFLDDCSAFVRSLVAPPSISVIVVLGMICISVVSTYSMY